MPGCWARNRRAACSWAPDGVAVRVCALQSGTSADGIDMLVVDAEIDGDALSVNAVRDQRSRPGGLARAGAAALDRRPARAGHEVRRSGAARVLVSGGGVHNPVLMRRLAAPARVASTAERVASTAERGVDPDSRENLTFAVVGLLSWFGTPVEAGGAARRIAGRFTPSPQGLVLPAPRPSLTRMEIRE